MPAVAGVWHECGRSSCAPQGRMIVVAGGGWVSAWTTRSGLVAFAGAVAGRLKGRGLDERSPRADRAAQLVSDVDGQAPFRLGHVPGRGHAHWRARHEHAPQPGPPPGLAPGHATGFPGESAKEGSQCRHSWILDLTCGEFWSILPSR